MKQQRMSVSIIVPAYNEGSRIGNTLASLRASEDGPRYEIIVVDDCSRDATYMEAAKHADIVLRHDANKGKGEALQTGLRKASGEAILFLDADLEDSARHAWMLAEPVLEGQADMAVARFPATTGGGGFGLVKGLAREGIYRLCGFKAEAPLSGQRAIRKAVLDELGELSSGFGIEVGLTIDAVSRGYRVCEVEIPFRHRETGKDLGGFLHRGKQFAAVARTLLAKRRERA